MKTIIILLFVTASTYASTILNPSDTLTPGWYCDIKNPDFIEYRYKEKVPVCKRNVTVSMKNKVYDSYNVAVSDRIFYTIDHKVPLSLGGSNDQLNLRPQLKEISSASLEGFVYNLIKSDKINKTEAINLILSVKKMR